jgi:hypothetical protein
MASIFSASTGIGSPGNPFDATSGEASFFAGPGAYDVKIEDMAVPARFATRTIRFESQPGDEGIIAQMIAAGTISTTAIADGAVVANKIASNAVGNAKIADRSVTGLKLSLDLLPSAGAPASAESLRSIGGLASQVVGGDDARIPTFVTALPAGQPDGKIVTLQTAAMATAGIVWMLRLRAGTGWEFLGGSSLTHRILGEGGTAVNGPVNLVDVGPQVVVPAAGLYEIEATVQSSTDVTARSARVYLDPLFNSGTGSGLMASVHNNQHTTQTRSVELSLAAGQTVLMQYGAPGSTHGAFFSNRLLRVTPKRLNAS